MMQLASDDVDEAFWKNILGWKTLNRWNHNLVWEWYRVQVRHGFSACSSLQMKENHSSIYSKWNGKLTHAKHIWNLCELELTFVKWNLCEMRSEKHELMMELGCFMLGCTRFSIRNKLHMCKWSQNSKSPIIAKFVRHAKQSPWHHVWS